MKNKCIIIIAFILVIKYKLLIGLLLQVGTYYRIIYDNTTILNEEKTRQKCSQHKKNIYFHSEYILQQ